MNKIKVLPDNLSNQIAAGEVVERPASVIKELLENSLDAGATRLQIEVELGGRRLMRVTDDGEGMVRDDAVLAFERHATSKISKLEDLSRIETLGFRGEALASIASVAKVELVTKVANETVGTRVYIEGGRLIDVKDAARPTGTTITVRDLFFNTPARRKFMRSEATENYHLTGIVTHYALAHPEIAFTLTNNGREVFRVSPARDLRERAFQIFGAGLIESLLPVEGGREFVAKIRGFVSAPRERRTTRDAQYFFINGRFVRDKIIAGGLLEGYRSVLPHGVYPVAFLFLEIPLEEVDVNVHPSKTEVRFRRSEAVKEVIAEAVREALKNAGIVRNTDFETRNAGFEEIKSPKPALEPQVQQKIDFAPQISNETNFVENLTPPPPEKNQTTAETETTAKDEGQRTEDESQNIEIFSNDFETAAAEKSPENISFKIEERKESFLKSDEQELSSENQFSALLSTPNAQLPPVNSAEKLVKKVEPENVSASKIRPIGQLHESYIIAMDDEGLLLVDQHVAHERILFDKFRRRETERKIESQNLLLPETLDLSPAQAAAFDLVETELENLGFSLMRLSGRTVAIKAVPADLPPSEARNLLAEVLDTVEKEKSGGAKATLRDDIAASLACKAAVKVNMPLSTEKMQWLIDRLLTTSSPTTCPHGRPVILRLTMRDIERGFHRT
jgi:DNA mismatch repair protein MutL